MKSPHQARELTRALICAVLAVKKDDSAMLAGQIKKTITPFDIVRSTIRTFTIPSEYRAEFSTENHPKG
jgi:hypothetical protein